MLHLVNSNYDKSYLNMCEELLIDYLFILLAVNYMMLIRIFLAFDECFQDPTTLCSVSDSSLMLLYNISSPAQNLQFQHTHDH